MTYKNIQSAGTDKMAHIRLISGLFVDIIAIQFQSDAVRI